MGRRPPDFFLSANKVPPNNKDVILSGQFPASVMFIKMVSDERMVIPTSLQVIRSSMCWWRIPSAPQPTRRGRNKPCASRRPRLSGRQLSLMVGVVVQTYPLEEGASLAVPPRTLNRLEPGSRCSRGCEQLHECCLPPT